MGWYLGWQEGIPCLFHHPSGVAVFDSDTGAMLTGDLKIPKPMLALLQSEIDDPAFGEGYGRSYDA
jgi:hypothetical protein